MALSRLKEWFPIPIVAIVVLLAALIVITPNLVSTGRPAAGSLETVAELLVDRAPHQNVTWLYVKGIDNVRYASVVISLNGTVAWPGPAAGPSEYPNVTRWTDVIVAAVATTMNPVAVNVSAVYVDTSNVTARYVGLFEFNLTDGTLYTQPIGPAAGSVTATPETSLPLTFLLEIASLGGRP